ncbi:sugar transferase [Salipiger sp. IMCC34102]|nr:sugar transferase [Salipiger sp. IMCC34102]
MRLCDYGTQVTASHPDYHSSLAQPRKFYGRLGKPIFDIFFVLLLLPVLVPVICVLALIVSLDGAAPFYTQRRVGRNGRLFWIWKLRTMVPDADARLEAHLAADPRAREEWNDKQKLTDDPRITRFGRILRRTSMDELPQFLNVLSGQMSVVGPRPMMAGQEVLYPGRSYYALYPGVTGSWQVSDRNATSFAARAAYDDAYARSVSFRTDLAVIHKTVRVVLRATGC